MNTTSTRLANIPIGHIHDPASMDHVLAELSQLHGPSYGFSVGTWQGKTRIGAHAGRTSFRFVVDAEAATIGMSPGNLVRGPTPHRLYGRVPGGLAEVQTEHEETLWPGDVICLTAGDVDGVWVHGRATFFEVETEATDYPAPRLVLLRNLVDRPGGCAAYSGAFRREALPPVRAPAGAADQRGLNRVNEHTLDMRIDRSPPPIRHFHGPVPLNEEKAANHSETAIVLSRAVYGLPEVGEKDRGHVVIYRCPDKNPADTVVVPVQPGSVLVTPASAGGVTGHCFEDCFAMLVAIPGFVAPYNMLD